MLNLNFKKWVRGRFSGKNTIVRNVLGNEITLKYNTDYAFCGYFNTFSFYSQYYDGSSSTGRSDDISLIVGSGTPTDYALGNAILKTVLHADAASTGVSSGSKLTVRVILRNTTTSPVTVSEVGLYAIGPSATNIIAQPGNANTFMIASQTIDPVTIAPDEHIAIQLEFDFPEVTE